MTSHRLPPKPHPIASAFFNAHDDELETTKADTSRISSTVAKMRNSLGWRTRYSSSKFYPISILPVEERKRSEEEEGESASFLVRQVFPGVSNREKACDNDGDANNKTQLQQLHDSVREDDCEFGTGATVWPGSIVLLKYLEKVAHDPQQDNVLQGKTVADLGSGTAITSIASALLGASEVVCTDGCDPVVDLARRNIHDAISLLSGEELVPTNQHCDFRGCKMIAQKYRWGEGMPLEECPSDTVCDDHNIIHDNQQTEAINNKMQRKGKHFDIILGADCIVPKLYPIEPLVDALDELSADETVSYLSYEQRYYEHFDPAVEFRRLAELRNLEVDIVPDHEMHPMYPANDIQIW
eukprot:CAMPEP_0172312930 /NCGR_PEP_ID=MMETSP1058-20130122/18829_1 /TAXON_ID=83371 /ORGANISM="Detonula confervacea, Strain CCMP 353" /LENGTH=353 /DNA_ID=CAMNT_0013026499 /DNA_START=31 /DNA_END=1089 /DNA_ORIENTATION=-